MKLNTCLCNIEPIFLLLELARAFSNDPITQLTFRVDAYKIFKFEDTGELNINSK